MYSFSYPTSFHKIEKILRKDLNSFLVETFVCIIAIGI